MFKVLIVDDERITLEFLRVLVDWQTQGFEIVGEALSAKKAVELMREHRPDVVFLDIRMPQVSGLELAGRLAEIRPETKIVLLSAYKEFDYARNGIALGVFDYLLKHELSRDRLMRTLAQLHVTLLQAREDQRAKMHTLVSDVLDRRGEKRLSAAQLAWGKQFCYLILEADRPVPLVDLPKTPAPEPPPNIWEFEPDRAEMLDVVRLSERQWGLLMLVEVMPSQRQTVSLLLELASLFQERFSRDTRESASIVVSPLFDELAELRMVVRQLQDGMGLYPVRGGQISGGLFGKLETPDAARLGGAVRELMAQSMPDGTADFENDERADWSERRLVEAMRALCAALDARRSAAGAERVADRVRANEFDLSQWIGMESALAWLRDEALNTQGAQSRGILTLQAVRYIREHYQQNITVAGIASEIGVSAAHIRRVFKRDMGCSIKAFLDNYRIERSRMYLRTGLYHNYEVAQMCGFSSAEYFSTVFKQSSGMTPQRYMTQQMSGHP